MIFHLIIALLRPNFRLFFFICYYLLIISRLNAIFCMQAPIEEYSLEELLEILNGKLVSKESLDVEINKSRAAIRDYCIKNDIGNPTPAFTRR